jgi:hypothetical protein
MARWPHPGSNTGSGGAPESLHQDRGGGSPARREPLQDLLARRDVNRGPSHEARVAGGRTFQGLIPRRGKRRIRRVARHAPPAPPNPKVSRHLSLCRLARPLSRCGRPGSLWVLQHVRNTQKCDRNCWRVRLLVGASSWAAGPAAGIAPHQMVHGAALTKCPVAVCPWDGPVAHPSPRAHSFGHERPKEDYEPRTPRGRALVRAAPGALCCRPGPGPAG